jgi:hypothetical protein
MGLFTGLSKNVASSFRLDIAVIKIAISFSRLRLYNCRLKCKHDTRECRRRQTNCAKMKEPRLRPPFSSGQRRIRYSAIRFVDQRRSRLDEKSTAQRPIEINRGRKRGYSRRRRSPRDRRRLDITCLSLRRHLARSPAMPSLSPHHQHPSLSANVHFWRRGKLPDS